MSALAKSFHIHTSIFDFLKQEFETNPGESIVAIKPKISMLNVNYSFYENGVLSYYGVLQNSKKVITHEFILHNHEGEKLGMVQKTPIRKKKSLFEEFIVVVEKEVYHVESTAANKKIIVKNQQGDLIVEADRISSIVKRLISYNSYNVHIYGDLHEPVLWVVIIKGVLELMS